MDISLLTEKYKNEDKKGLWGKIGEVIESKDGRWDKGIDGENQELTQLLIYEYANSLEAITNGELKAEFVVEKLSATLGTIRIGDFKKGQDDKIKYDNKSVTSEEYKRLCRIDNHFGAHQVDYEEDGKIIYSTVIFDESQTYQSDDGKVYRLSGGNFKNLDDIRQTLFHEWTHVMEKCLVKTSELTRDDIIKTRGNSTYINAYLSPDLTMDEYLKFIENVDQILEEQDEVLFGGISTIEINEKKSPNKRIMHNQISEGATELISKMIMEYLGRPIEDGRYKEQADFVLKVFESIGIGKGIATYLTSSNKIISYIESKNYGDKDILRDTDSFITALGNFERTLREMTTKAGNQFGGNFENIKQKIGIFWKDGKNPTERDIQTFFEKINKFANVPKNSEEYVRYMINFALTYPKRRKEVLEDINRLFTEEKEMESENVVEEGFNRTSNVMSNNALSKKQPITQEQKQSIEIAARKCVARLGVEKVSEVQIQKVLSDLYKMNSIKDAIDLLTMKVSNIFGKPETKEEFKDCIKDIMQIEPSVYSSSHDLIAQLRKNIETNYTPGNISVEENHSLIERTLKNVCDKLNQLEVDYYIVGALSTFIKSGVPLFRYHGDIDFMVSEADLPKVQEALAESEYVFSDERLNNEKRYSEEVGHTQGEHEVIANHKENEFHLGFFLFRREEDKSITVREYFMEENNGIKRPKILERNIPSALVNLEYSEDLTEYSGTRFRTSTLESVLAKKMHTRHPKDMLDIKAVVGRVNPWKLAELQRYHTTTRVVEIDDVSKNIPKKVDRDFPDFDD